MKEIKCVVWDLDHTLWDGILSEGDPVKLKDGITEIIKELDHRGILLSISSKNNMSDAMAQLEQFGLKEYFLYPQINWSPKSESMKIIKDKLNIGLDTFLFIDDQGFEREEVASIHPDIRTLNAAEYHSLLTMPALNPKMLTAESQRRRLMYMEEEIRQEEEKYSETPRTFLERLNMKFTIAKANMEDLKRAEELTVRTNQLNSTGIQYDYQQLEQFMTDPDYCLLVCELTDRFGSYGKIGLVLLETRTDIWKIKLLLMSCRIVSRGVGTVLLSYIMKTAKAAGKRLQAEFKKTGRNRQMMIAYQLANFIEVGRDKDELLLENDLSTIQPYPPYIEIIASDQLV